jgi:GNAT superfamily N-acetyltransferase
MPSSSPTSSKERTREAPRLRPIVPADRAPIEALLRATGSFTEEEVEVALELIDEDPEEGYRFVVAELASTVVGYACFGLTPLTDGVYDLYWIAVDPTRQGFGIGRALLIAVDEEVRRLGGRMVIIETASKPSYEPTRVFYDRTGCVEVARIPDFYRVGDDKVIYARRV